VPWQIKQDTSPSIMIGRVIITLVIGSCALPALSDPSAGPLDPAVSAFVASGYAHVPSSRYIEQLGLGVVADLPFVQQSYGTLQADINQRWRAYRRYTRFPDGSLWLDPSSDYGQPAETHYGKEGGKVRRFQPISEAVLETATMRGLLAEDTRMAFEAAEVSGVFNTSLPVRIGLHMIR
jgi:hypothetical protein